MKTFPASTAQFSNHPSGSEPKKEEAVPSQQIISSQMNTGVLLPGESKNKIDCPENWDESWFANYE